MNLARASSLETALVSFSGVPLSLSHGSGSIFSGGTLLTRCGCITIFANSRIRSHSSRYPVPATVPDGSPSGSDPQPGLDNNPGIDAKLFADSHPYIANAYQGAQEAVKNAVREMEEWDIDKTYGDRLRINKKADKTELEDNIRAAKGLLGSFKDMIVKIREHVLIDHVSNPEYEINGIIADRKGIESPKGISSAFSTAIKQGCQIVVIDLDMRMKNRTLQTIKLSGKLYNRHFDFEEGIIKECYVIYHGKAVCIDGAQFIPDDKEASLELIKEKLEELIQK